MDDESGLAVAFPPADAEPIWAIDKFKLNVFTTPSNDLVLFRGDSKVGELANLRSRHDVAEISMVREPHGASVLVKATGNDITC